MLLVIVVWIFCGIGAAFVAQSRGASGCLWFGLGVLLGPFGLAFAFASGTDRRCPSAVKESIPKLGDAQSANVTLLLRDQLFAKMIPERLR
jgi:hypothetical protein